MSQRAINPAHSTPRTIAASFREIRKCPIAIQLHFIKLAMTHYYNCGGQAKHSGKFPPPCYCTYSGWPCAAAAATYVTGVISEDYLFVTWAPSSLFCSLASLFIFVFFSLSLFSSLVSSSLARPLPLACHIFT